MDRNHNEDEFIHQLFQDQKKREQELTPGFSAIFRKAQRKYQIMKNIRLVLIVVAGLILLSGIALLANKNKVEKGEIKVARAGISLYDRLQNDGKIVTTDIKFAFDRADLLPESMPIVQSIAGMMKEHPEVRLRIGGHTDAQGSESYNTRLSGARAGAVRQALVGLGIDGNRLESQGYGEAQPVGDNSTEQGRAQNRRVEFVPF
ncbi:MAG: OmpA family protein [Saprospiraceae bacterium]|nr:OmpA family protein [Lewinella sp.]